MKRIIAFFIFLCAITINATAQGWIGTWATAPQTVVKSFMPYNNNMSNRSVRQVVKVSIGGDMIRLKLSNIYSTEPVVIRSIYIAHAKAPNPPGTTTRLLPMPRLSTPWLVILYFSWSISDMTSGQRFWALSVEHFPSVMELPMMAMLLRSVLIVYMSMLLMLYQWFSRKAFSKLEWALVTPFMI